MRGGCSGSPARDGVPSSSAVQTTCLGCGCVCDDIELAVTTRGRWRIDGACQLGVDWFTRQAATRPPTMVGERETGVERALDAAAGILARARHPLVYGLGESSVEAQRQAVRIAEALCGTIDLTGPLLDGPIARAIQSVGVSTATLGEVRHRADLVICWRADPLTSHPRHLSRYSLEPIGLQSPNGRRDRTLLVVDSTRTPTARIADRFLEVPADVDFDLLWALRALLMGRTLAAALPERVGLTADALTSLVGQLRGCRYGAVLFGPALSAGSHLRSTALLSLVADLNRFTRFVALPLRREANAAGAEDVLAWRTGYPSAVNFSRGYPRSDPEEFSAVGLLTRREVDAAVILGGDPLIHLPVAAAEHLRRIPVVTVGSHATATAAAADVAIRTAALGVECGGTVHRMDGVPLQVRPVLGAGHPTETHVLELLLGRVTAAHHG